MDNDKTNGDIAATKNAVRALAIFIIYGALWTVIGGALIAGGFYYNLTAFRIWGDATEGNAAILIGAAVVILGNLGSLIAAIGQLNRRN